MKTNITGVGDFNFIRELVRRHSAIVLEADKDYLIEARLTPLARQSGFASLEEFIASLRANSAPSSLRCQVVEAMATHETSFFRDLHPFEVLKTTVLPELLARRQSAPLTIWCAACSSGQEPFSLAMLVREHFPAASSRVRIIATDFSGAILTYARTGLYNQVEVNRGLPTRFLTRYFQKLGLRWRIKPEILQMIEFKQHNLAEPWSAIPPADIVFMRNVLIYFDAKTKKAILARTRRVLKPDGYLFLGSSETTLNLDAAFELIFTGKSVCYKPR